MVCVGLWAGAANESELFGFVVSDHAAVGEGCECFEISRFEGWGIVDHGVNKVSCVYRLVGGHQLHPLGAIRVE